MPAGPPGCWALPAERNTPLQARAGPGDDQRGVGARAPQADEGPEAQPWRVHDGDGEDRGHLGGADLVGRTRRRGRGRAHRRWGTQSDARSASLSRPRARRRDSPGRGPCRSAGRAARWPATRWLSLRVHRHRSHPGSKTQKLAIHPRFSGADALDGKGQAGRRPASVGPRRARRAHEGAPTGTPRRGDPGDCQSRAAESPVPARLVSTARPRALQRLRRRGGDAPPRRGPLMGPQREGALDRCLPAGDHQGPGSPWPKAPRRAVRERLRAARARGGPSAFPASRRRVVMDDPTLDVPDSTENAGAFGRPSTPKRRRVLEAAPRRTR